jgi:hypothetical protein
MKLWKKVTAALIVVALLAGAAAWAVVKPVPVPARRAPLYEDPPAGNPLRTALQVDGVGGSRFFIQSPDPGAL